MRPEGNDSVTVRSHAGRSVGRALLIERLALGAVDESLENDRTVPDPTQRARRDRQVIAHQIEFGQLRLLREIRLVRMRHADLAPVDGKHFGSFVLHEISLPHFVATKV